MRSRRPVNGVPRLWSTEQKLAQYFACKELFFCLVKRRSEQIKPQPLITKTMKKFIIPLLIAALAATTVFQVSAADAKPGEKKEAQANRAIPFRGKIATVDKQAKTVKVGERTFQATADTRIMKAGKPATLDDATVGEEVGGQYREGADKTLNLVSLRIGARPDAAAAPKKDDKKEK